MSSKNDHAERVALLALVFRRIARKDAGDFRCYRTAADVVAIAKRLESAAVRHCNGDMDTETYGRRQGKALKRLNELVGTVEGLGIFDLVWQTGGDPRGHVLKFTHPQVAGNTWGGSKDGDEYGV